MKKLKLITTLTALGSIAAATPIVVTGCSSNDKQDFTDIKYNGKTIPDKLEYPLGSEDYELFANKFTAKYNGNEVTMNSVSATSSTDAVTVIPSNDLSVKLHAAKEGTSDIKVTLKDADNHEGSFTVKFTVTAQKGETLTIDKANMGLLRTKTQSIYVEATNTVRAWRDAQFTGATTGQTDFVEIPFTTENALADSFNPATDLKAEFKLENTTITLEEVTFAWTTGQTDKKHITMSLGQKAYFKLPIYDSYSVTITDTTGTAVAPLNFNIKKGHYQMQLGDNGASVGGFICAGTADENPIVSVWNGVTTEKMAYLELAIPELPAGFTFTKFEAHKGAGILPANKINIYAKDEKPEAGDKIYFTSDAEAAQILTTKTLTLTIATGESLPTLNIKVRGIDATGHVVSTAIDVAGITTKCEAQKSSETVGALVDGEELDIGDAIESADSLVFAKNDSVTGTVATWKAYIGDRLVPKTLTNATRTFGDSTKTPGTYDLDAASISKNGEQVVVYGYSDAAATKVLCTFVFTAKGTD